jgi:hypothetical protein
MQAIEKDSNEGTTMSYALATPAAALDASRTQDEMQEPLLCGERNLLSPPLSTLSRSNCEFTHNYHPNDKITGNNAVQKHIIIPKEKMASSLAAMEREYDMETWKMYLRIQSSRSSFACDRESVIGEDVPVHVCHDVSLHDELDTEPIFELELDL